MKGRIGTAVFFCVLIAAPAAFAHRIDEYLQATLLTMRTDRVDASMRLIPGVLVAPSIIAAIDTDDDGVFSAAEEQAYAQRVLAELSLTVDGKSVQPTLVSSSFPQPAQMRDGLGEIHIDYAVDLPAGGSNRTFTLSNRHLQASSVYLVNVVEPENGNPVIVAQKRNERQSSYELDFQEKSAASRPPWFRALSWLNGLQLGSLFHLGMRHIAEGTDHLLFLLVLLLPAPLFVTGSRWGPPASVRQSILHIFGIVTAFTVGHSLTLTLAAIKFVHVPGRPVEVLIAVSILVSAAHALRPIFPGRETWIAAFFGLIHGLAFASTLDRLGLSRWDRLAGILSFNLGIETMQLLVVAFVLPSLLLMSRTSAYAAFRIGGAAFACAASAMWIAERALKVQTPIDAIVNVVAQRGLVSSVLLFAASLLCLRLDKRSEGVRS